MLSPRTVSKQVLRCISISLIVLSLMPVARLFAQEGAASHVRRSSSDVSHRPGNDSTVTAEGRTQRQPVGAVDVKLTLDLLGDPQAETGTSYPLTVRVDNSSLNTATNVRVRISIELKTKSGAVLPLRGIRYRGAGVGGCRPDGSGRICPLGEIPPLENRSTEICIEVERTVRADGLAFSANLLDTNIATVEKPVHLVSGTRPRTEADLRLTMERGFQVVQPGMRFAHIIKIRNVSGHEPASDVDLEIRQRMRESEGLRIVPNNEALQGSIVSPPEYAQPCTGENLVYRCRFRRIAPGEEIRLAVEMAIKRELGAGTWGLVETQAYVR